MASRPHHLPQTASIRRPNLIPGRWLASGLLASALTLAALMAQAGLVLDIHNPANQLTLVLGLAAAAIWLALRESPSRQARAARDVIEYFAFFALISLIGALATYPLAADSHGFIDPLLARSDRLLRFDWLRWYDIVAAHPDLQLAEFTAYESIFVTPAVLLGYFALTERKAEARVFIAAFWVAAVVTLALFGLVPAEGPLAFLSHGHVTYMPASALYQSELIPALRNHAVHDVGVGNLRGLVCVPSFHAASAVLFIATAWPVARLRWPVTLLNVAMLFATPIEGTHYLTDMIAGALVATLALLLVRWVTMRLADAPL